MGSDPKANDVKVNVSDDMRVTALAVAEMYNHLLNDLCSRTSSSANTDVFRKTALEQLKKTKEYHNLIGSIYAANPELNPENMGGIPQQVNMRATWGGVVNDFIAEVAKKAGIKNIPAPFRSSVQQQG